jgi:hypothetical protein
MATIDTKQTMHLSRKVLLSALVWLTGVMTLVANTAHFVCRCPNGQLKPFCLGLNFRAASADAPRANCCCDGQCCGACENGQAGSGGAAVPSCCRRGHKPATQDNDPIAGSALHSNCCSQTLVQPEVTSISRQQSRAALDTTFDQFLVLGSLPAHALMTSGSCPVRWHDFQRPPPTDLVVTLLHLVI